MPVLVKFTNTTTCPEQGFVIPDATSKNDGVMTKAQAAQLAALVGGSAGFVDLPLEPAFSEANPPLDNLGSRLIGTTVQFRGGAICAAGGTGNGAQITQLPPEQRPSKVRAIPTAVDTFNGHTVVANCITIDDKFGTNTGIPGGVFLSVAVTAGADKVVLFDGLSFTL